MNFPVESYSFAITPIFRHIRLSTEVAGAYLHQRDAKETLQFYSSEKAFQEGQPYWGAIQYEGSNDYGEKEPSLVSWRFKRANLPEELRQELEAIEAFRQDTNSGASMDPQAESIAFKFGKFDLAAKATMKEIRNALENFLTTIHLEENEI
ncbi:hypothetical protein AB1K83_13330 [Sporosarcina sp. 179-K 3D1 HS]|uniref:hypothetical protein n=1 Tax=Sporosarcina sp. 179-K 3D1 HS TaxID=3232169 RepID=UPI0039A207A6